MKRTIGLMIVAGALAAGVAVPSSADTGLGLYKVSGRLKFFQTESGPEVSGSANLSLMRLADRPAGLRVSPGALLSITGSVRRRVTVAPNPCLAALIAAAVSIRWSDYGASSGTATILVADTNPSVPLRALIGHVSITSGRFAGGTLEIVARSTGGGSAGAALEASAGASAAALLNACNFSFIGNAMKRH